MNHLIKSVADEFRRYKAMAEGALAQVPEVLLCEAGPGNGNSLAIICWHVSGNLQSRFTDFLVADGEKPWREREEEFAIRAVLRQDLLIKWEAGWGVLFATLDSLANDDLERRVTIRSQPLAVHEALHRSLAHVCYHVGQIVYVAHYFRGPEWNYLTIPPGQSTAYNAAPGAETPLAHAAHLKAIAERFHRI